MNMPIKIKKFFAFDGKPPITYREGTSDGDILHSLFGDRPEYKFPKFSPKIVFDVGGNIGAVAVLLANIYPESKIYTFEPVVENFDFLAENVKEYPNIVACNYGLGVTTGVCTMYKSDDERNLGGFSLSNGVGNVKKGGFLADIRAVCETVREFGNPDLIKIDTEGSEYAILQAIPDLSATKWIAGELHGTLDFATLDLLDKHFKIMVQRNFEDRVFHFHALSRGWKDFGLDQSPQA